ncbi:putative Cut9-interacting protein scn1 [Monocercomonoides exilis]|uniref:putative Cut9-interacting protein scn1 n=1 Tax=Monocercomonoides exilis TaxID=2049356 RepID=UPI003559EE10|nr:putative Cut9-interacting protein scn1 [Monocercomonoides exilis]|eukprot:MONOS_4457.1-p1 / transcript=MONOS_4457.1 / gene=MONOS_4457 / organism=Monocercomonoides_exilis_PA203 / gene_product=putative protein / transcript_product=putative protein / location=Mono_scaffold00118:104488-105756(-) / protein_length=422 / sequence_SO=supercontig / SO=protein_coding / is_pseudo=false
MITNEEKAFSCQTPLKSKFFSEEKYYIDTHCHLCDCEHVDDLLEHAAKANVKIVISCGTSEEDWNENEHYAEKSQISQQNILDPSIAKIHQTFVIPFFGYHPWFLDKRTPQWKENLIKKLTQHPCSGVGEIGIDKLKTDKSKKGSYPSLETQCSAFKEQLDIAYQMNRPCSVHCVRAVGNLYTILCEQRDINRLPPAIILHSYGGPPDFVPLLLEAGSPSCRISSLVKKEEASSSSTPSSSIFTDTKKDNDKGQSHLTKPSIALPESELGNPSSLSKIHEQQLKKKKVKRQLQHPDFYHDSHVWFSFSGTIFDHSKDNIVSQSASFVPLNRLLIETDAPTFDSKYASYKEGLSSEPSAVVSVAEELLNAIKNKKASENSSSTTSQDETEHFSSLANDTEELTPDSLQNILYHNFLNCYKSIL